eukprot:TRINITY_DN16229_c0_g1_i1.p1 TRINITY_DN16229_c0_g1~~TRINITY_DN16229_c0_g1_i1.p1  ORF type:complete len:356 (-),score=62.49 TRINITY_DN16229_c0_g1_i1:390-1457(-)
MKNNRERQGATGIDWSQAVMTSPYKRKTFGFGKYNSKERRHEMEIYIRELTLAAGALGCAVWDGGVVLARWVFTNRALFAGKSVLELGSGCGLPGILAARYCDTIVLSDYIDKVLDNLQYNVELNSRAPGDDDNEDSEDEEDRPPPPTIDAEGNRVRWDLRGHSKVAFLDWDALDAKDAPAGGAALCTVDAARTRTYLEQPWYRCNTCYEDEPTKGCCKACTEHCHAGHSTEYVETSRFVCDCGLSAACRSRPQPFLGVQIDPVDIIIGSELTYNMLSVRTLPGVIERFLKPDGVFYEVLSDDRDGVSAFVEEITARGFTAERVPVGEELASNFNTRDWAHQKDETYSLWVFRRG